MSFAPHPLGAREDPPPDDRHPALEWAKALALAALWTAGVKAAEKCAEWGVEAIKERAKKRSPPVAPKPTVEDGEST